MPEIDPVVLQAIHDTFRSTITDYYPPTREGDTLAKAGADYAAEQIAVLAKLWGTGEFWPALRVAQDNVALKAGLAGHGAQEARQRQANAAIRAGLLMAARIAVALV